MRCGGLLFERQFWRTEFFAKQALDPPKEDHETLLLGRCLDWTLYA